MLTRMPPSAGDQVMRRCQGMPSLSKCSAPMRRTRVLARMCSTRRGAGAVGNVHQRAQAAPGGVGQRRRQRIDHEAAEAVVGRTAAGGRDAAESGDDGKPGHGACSLLRMAAAAEAWAARNGSVPVYGEGRGAACKFWSSPLTFRPANPGIFHPPMIRVIVLAIEGALASSLVLPVEMLRAAAQHARAHSRRAPAPRGPRGRRAARGPHHVGG
jgi:hypothetical protein